MFLLVFPVVFLCTFITHQNLWRIEKWTSSCCCNCSELELASNEIYQLHNRPDFGVHKWGSWNSFETIKITSYHNAELQRTAPDTKNKEAFSTRGCLFFFLWITFFLKNVMSMCEQTSVCICMCLLFNHFKEILTYFCILINRRRNVSLHFYSAIFLMMFKQRNSWPDR